METDGAICSRKTSGNLKARMNRKLSTKSEMNFGDENSCNENAGNKIK